MLHRSKEELFTVYLRWFETDQNSTIQAWKAEIRQAIKTHIEELSIILKEREKYQLTTGAYYCRFALLSLLISRHFDSCLAGLLENDWKIFDRLYSNNEKRSDIENLRKERAENLFYRINEYYNLSFYWLNQPVARILEPWEKRLWLEEFNHIDKTVKPIEKRNDTNIDQFSRRYTAKNRLHLSIDPHASPETVARAVTAIVAGEQEAARREIEASWADHGPDFATRTAEEHQAGFDLRRSAATGKNARSLHGTLFTWLRALRTWDARRAGLKEQDILNAPWFLPKTGSAQKDCNLALRLIEAALNGVPLAMVNPDPRPHRALSCLLSDWKKIR